MRINSLKKNKSKEEFQRKTERARWKKMELFALSSLRFFFWCNHKLIPCTKRILLLLIIIIICNLSFLDVYEEMFLFVEPQSLLYLATKLQITLHNKGGGLGISPRTFDQFIYYYYYSWCCVYAVCKARSFSCFILLDLLKQFVS